MSRSRVMRNLAAAGLLTAVAACADTTGSDTTPSARVVSGNGQSATRGTTLPQPLVLEVVAGGRPAVGVPITWLPSSGSLSAASQVTNAEGRAAAIWTLGPVAGPMTITATVGEEGATPLRFTAQALPLVAVTPDPAASDQRGVVGTTLPMPLRVTVTADGEPAVGVPVSWRTDHGTITPALDTTDALGVASAVLRLGYAAGPSTVWVAAPGAGEVPAFRAVALAGPASAIGIRSGNGQSVPANRTFAPLTATVTDSSGNVVSGQPVVWSVVSGPVAIGGAPDSTNGMGWSTCSVAPIWSPGVSGAAVVRASLPGGQSSVEFTLVVTLAVWQVELQTSGSYGFYSRQNHTMPAVDTVPAGTTVQWVLAPFDYDSHSVTPVGAPALRGGGDFPYANPSVVAVTFAAPGTYRYTDSYYGGTGVVVVR